MCVYPISLRNIPPPSSPSITIDGLQLLGPSCIYARKVSADVRSRSATHIVRVGTNLFADIPPEMDGPWVHPPNLFIFFSFSLLASLSLHVYGCASNTAEKMKVERKQYKSQKKIGKKWRGFQIIKQKYAQQQRMYV